MTDAEILEAITGQYGDRLQKLSLAQKLALLSFTTLNFSEDDVLDWHLEDAALQLSPNGAFTLIEALVAQIRATAGPVLEINPAANSIPLTEKVRVTILYPRALYPKFDRQIEKTARIFEGQVIGGGTDGNQRDVVVDFPVYPHSLTDGVCLFISRCLDIEDCQVIIDRLKNEGTAAASADEPDDITAFVGPGGGR